FKGDYRTRFTLFVPAPRKSDYIIPWYRHFQGAVDDPVTEASRSKARYRRGEGATGKAWEQAGREVLVSSFPVFDTRQQFETFYIDRMHVDSQVVRELSQYMVGVQTIFSYGFVSSNHRTLGVLSLDLQAPTREPPSVVVPIVR